MEAPMRTRRPSRRTVLAGAASLGVTSLSPLSASTSLAQSAAIDWSKGKHGLSVFGDLELPEDFRHFGYVNPNAPKGGTISLQINSLSGNQNFNTFDSFQIYILKGNGAAGVPMIFDTLMSGTGDEPDALYGLVADRVLKTEGKPEWRFRLRPEARFHDGSPLTAEDVAFSLNILKEKGHPNLSQSLRDLVAAEAEAPHVLRVELAPNPPRDLILTVAGLPIFSKAYYTKHPFDQTSLEPPLGSGPYRIGRFSVGRFIEMERVPTYWGRDLPVNVGENNFDRVRYEYFKDRAVAFQGFTAREFLIRQENTSRIWATSYDFPAVKDGRVIRDTIPTGGPVLIQGWYFNMRRPKFADRRIREAIMLAFDFEWTNRNVMYSSFERNHSFFQNTPLQAKGRPSPEELAVLEPFRAQLEPEVFGEAFVPPVTDGSGQDRAILRRAGQLLQEAGTTRGPNGMLRLPDGQPLTFEFLDFETSLHPHVGGFRKNLTLLGIDSSIRSLGDSAQYQKRMEEFDFDMTMRAIGGTVTPGDSLRVLYGSAAAQRSGSANIAGVSHPVVDALIERIGRADTRAELTVLARALDRVLRSLRFFVPAWFNNKAWLAYWDVFQKPERPPKMTTTSGFTAVALSTWWYDEEKAKKLGMSPSNRTP